MRIVSLIRMKCQSLFSGKIRKKITSLSSAEYGQRVVKVLIPYLTLSDKNVSIVTNVHICIFCII